MDLELYRPQIEQLIPLMAESDFNELLDRVLFGESTNTKFLIKMELNRLASPCARIIDLRNKLPSAAEYKHGNQRHFLDAAAIKTFEKQLKNYRGTYTMGVYEAVVNQKRKAATAATPTTSSKDILQADYLSFARTHARGAERMHFAIPVELHLDKEHSLKAITLDISTTGLRVKVPLDTKAVTGADLQIVFKGLQKEFSGPEVKTPVPYRIVGQDKAKEVLILRLCRTQQGSRFDNFIEGFIQGNKHRYKINTDNLTKSVVMKGYEQYYLPLMQGLPVFFSQQLEIKLESVLYNKNNLHIIEYWRDENANNCLSRLLSPARMEQILQLPGEVKETLIYSFTHRTDDCAYFFSATADELLAANLRTLFLAYGARKTTWRVYKLKLTTADTRILGQQFTENNPQDVSRIALEKAQEVDYVGLLTDITDLRQQKSYQQLQPDIKSANKLNRFISTHDDRFEQLPFKFVQQRQEKRYHYSTDVIASFGKQKMEGSTQDFSSRGLKIALAQALQVDKGDKVLVNLPKLQKLTKTMTLDKMPYQVVGFNPARTILHLSVDPKEKSHTGTEFFNLLIESNPGKLSESVEKLPKPGLELALRHLCCHHFLSSVAFVRRQQGHFDISKLAITPAGNSLTPLLSVFNTGRGSFNLTPIFGDHHLDKVVINRLKEMEEDAQPQKIEMFISLQKAEKVEAKRALSSAFADDNERKAFVASAMRNGHFFSVQVHISKVGKPDISSISRELDYIAQYAIHKAKKLEEELWAINAVVELTDTTTATLQRLGLTNR